MNNAKESSKYKYSKKLSSGAATFFSLINGPQETHPDFVYKPNPKPKIKLKTEQQILISGSKFVALELMALWIPKHGANSYNFISRYIHTVPDFSFFSMYLNEEVEEKYVPYTSTELDSIIGDYR